MPEVKYKFKSSLAFETVQFVEPTITVGELKELINKKQSIKTSGFDLKFKDCNGKIYIGDDEKIDLNCKIIVSRSPKVIKPVSIRKKDPPQVIKDGFQSANEIIMKSEYKLVDFTTKKNIDNSDASARDECINLPIPKPIVNIPITPDFMKCSLCHETMKNATTIHCCKRNFCYECIAGHLFDPEIAGSLQCPVCKAVVSNDSVNITQNIELREMISDLDSGKIDAATCDMLEKSYSSDIMPQNDVLDEDNIIDNDIISTKTSIKCDNTNERDIQMQDVDVDNDTNLFDDHLLNQISVTEVFEYQIQSHHSDLVNGTKPATVSDSIQSEKVIIYGDQNQLPNNTSVTNVPQCDNKINQDVTWNTNVTNSTTKQSIKDLEFDPVLYMKFLKIVGENYPEELRKILSNNFETNHGNKEDDKSRSSRTRSWDDDHRDRGSQKRVRRDVDSSGGGEVRYKREYNGMDRRVDDDRHYEEMDRRNNVGSNISTIITSSSSHMAGDRSHRSKDRLVRKSNGLPLSSGQQKRYNSRSRSRDVIPRNRDIEPRSRDIEPRIRDMEPRNRDLELRNRDIEPRNRDLDTRRRDRSRDLEPRSRDREHRSRDPEPRIRDVGPRSRDPEPRSRDVGPRSRDPEPRIRDMEPRIRDMEPRNRDMELRNRDMEPRSRDNDPRSKEYYNNQNTLPSSRYGRPHDNAPPHRDDRQRLRNDCSSQFRDNKPRFERRSDR